MKNMISLLLLAVGFSVSTANALDEVKLESVDNFYTEFPIPDNLIQFFRAELVSEDFAASNCLNNIANIMYDVNGDITALISNNDPAFSAALAIVQDFDQYKILLSSVNAALATGNTMNLSVYAYSVNNGAFATCYVTSGGLNAAAESAP